MTDPRRWISKACHRLITYTPATGRSRVSYGEHHSGMGSEQARVAWADTQTGYHDPWT